MSIWNWLFGDDTDATSSPVMDSPSINPATGLPMMGSHIGGLDVGGNPYGMDLHSSDTDWTSCNSAVNDIGGGISGDWP